MKQICMHDSFCTKDAEPGSMYCKDHQPKPEPKAHIDEKAERVQKWEHHHKKATK